MEINFGGQKLRALDSARATAGIYNLQNEVVWQPSDGDEKRLELVRAARESGTLAQYFIPHIIATDNPVRNNDVAEMPGAMLENYRKNPIVFYDHCPEYAVGQSKGLTLHEHSLVSNTWFHGLTEMSIDTAVLSLSGVVPMVSMGFIPIEEVEETLLADGTVKYPSWSNKRRRFKKWELFEYSIVSLPLDPSASELRKFHSLDELLRFGVSERLLPADSVLLRADKPVIITPPHTNRRNMDDTALTALRQAGADAMASLANSADYDAAFVQTLHTITSVGMLISAGAGAAAKDVAVQDLANSATEAFKALRDGAETLLVPAEAPPAEVDPNAPPPDPNAPPVQQSFKAQLRAGAVLSAANKQALQTAVEKINGVIQSAEPEKTQSFDAAEFDRMRKTMNEQTRSIVRLQSEIDTLKNKPAEAPLKFSELTLN